MKSENICVYETDKTSKFVVDSVENLKNKMEIHVKNDRVIDRKETTKIENKLNNETRQWVEILNIAENVNQKQRALRNLVSTNNPIPILRGTAKDHKIPRDPQLGHDLRPIMAARIGPNASLAQIGCKILRLIAENVRESVVIKSTEELLRKFEDFNTKMKNENPKGIKKVVMSMDVKNFYPSLDPVKAAKVARIMWLKSTIDLKNVNIEKLAKYVGKFCDFNEVKKKKTLQK